MNKNLKSFVWSLAVIFIYAYATLGIVRLFWNTDDDDKFEGRAKFLGMLLIILSLVYIIGIYHIVGPYRVDNFYYGIIIFHFIYLLLGNIVNAISPK
jgi:hypothetical protein